MKIKFRPHHFLCAIGFQGKGYTPEFVDNFSTIVESLKSPQGDHTEIEVINVTDSICTPCPHKRDNLCTTEDKIQSLDNNHAQILGITAGDKLTWGQAKQKIIENMTLDEFHKACSSCNWKSLGICEQALSTFRKRNIKD